MPESLTSSNALQLNRQYLLIDKIIAKEKNKAYFVKLIFQGMRSREID